MDPLDASNQLYLSKVIEVKKQFTQAILEYREATNQMFWNASKSAQNNICLRGSIRSVDDIALLLPKELLRNDIDKEELGKQVLLMKILLSKKDCPISQIIDEI